MCNDNKDYTCSINSSIHSFLISPNTMRLNNVKLRFCSKCLYVGVTEDKLALKSTRPNELSFQLIHLQPRTTTSGTTQAVPNGQNA